MPQIGVSAIEFDHQGARVMIQYKAMDNRSGGRRVSRTATLDGGAVLYDTGHAPADRRLVVATDLHHLDWLQRMTKLYTLINVATEEGFFRGAPRSWRVNEGRAEMEILVMEEL